MSFVSLVFLELDPLLPLVTWINSLPRWQGVAVIVGMVSMLYPVFKLFVRWLFDLSDDDDDEEDDEESVWQ